MASMGLVVSCLGIFIANKTTNNLLNLTADADSYTLTLDGSNSIGSAGDHVQKTAQGSDVTFTYSGVSTPTGNNHTTIIDGGTIVNKDIIHSISKFNAVFEGHLQARISYLSNKNWGGYFDLVSGQTIDLGSHPYYLELKAHESNVTLESATYTYTCQVNNNAEVQDTEGSYDITFKHNGSDSGTDLTTTTALNEVTSGSDYIDSIGSVSKVYPGTNGLKFGSSGNYGSLLINFDTTTVNQTITSIEVECAKYGSDTGVLEFYINNGSSHIDITPSATKGSIAVNTTLTSLRIETSTKRAYLCKHPLKNDTIRTPDLR